MRAKTAALKIADEYERIAGHATAPVNPAMNFPRRISALPETCRQSYSHPGGLEPVLTAAYGPSEPPHLSPGMSGSWGKAAVAIDDWIGRL
jgi:hypothetical protein